MGSARGLQQRDAVLPGERRPRRQRALHDRRRVVHARRREPDRPRPRDPHHQRLRWFLPRPGPGGADVREPRVRRARVLRARFRRIDLQDLPRRPRVRRQGGVAVGQLPRRGGRHRVHRPGGEPTACGARRRHPRQHRPSWRSERERPAGRDGRRVLRRRYPVRSGGRRPAHRHHHPAHHLERPDVLADPQRHRHRRGRQHRATGGGEGDVRVRAVRLRCAEPRQSRVTAPTRPGSPAARTTSATCAPRSRRRPRPAP